MTQPHVLLVEDDPTVRNATRVFLKMEGFRVTAAASLAEAVQHASASHDIDLIVSDYHLGGDDTGVDAIAAVRAELARPVSAILVTGDASAASRELRPDANLRITSKPIHVDHILGLMHELLER